jgi:pyruvate-formate lyase
MFMGEPRETIETLRSDMQTPVGEATARVKMLREAALAKTVIRAEEPALLWARSWMVSADEPWFIIRRGRACSDVLRGLTPVIDSGELIVGKYHPRGLTPEEREELQNWHKYAARALPYAGGQRSHMAIDYDKLLHLGIRGVKEEIENYRSRLNLDSSADLEKDGFYRACIIALDGVTDYANRYADHAEELCKKEPNESRQLELREIARICRKVPENPASTFREALQSVHFMTFCLCAGQRMSLFQLGRPDRYLWPFYQRDITEGRITPEEVQELLDCLCVMFNEYTPRALAVGFMVGGRDAHGNDVSNDLTRMLLDTIGHTRLSYPGIGLCWHQDMPADLLEKSAELLAQGLTHPAIFNDEVITKGMMDAGLPPAEACLYIHSTCVELSPIASSNVKVASPYINLIQALHDVLYVGTARTPGIYEPSGFSSFEELKGAIRSRLAEMFQQGIRAENMNFISRRYHGGYPLNSCFVNDCLRRGKDIDHGGARYNWVEPNFVGLANLADALAAIRRFVFREDFPSLALEKENPPSPPFGKGGIKGGFEESITLSELVKAIRENFDGREDLRQMLLNRSPKYGNDDDEVDALATEIVSWGVEECKRLRTFFDDTVHLGAFSWIMHERMGRETSASADGRLAGFPLSPAAGAAQGREKSGPTAVVKSTTKWDHTPMLGGLAVNLKFSETRKSQDFPRKLAKLIETFMLRGGMEIQVNVVDRDTLLKAQKEPQNYQDLVVRIAGYSDYFVNLSREMQEEVIMRTEHEF